MVCRQCRQERQSGRINYLGFFCSSECGQAFAEGRKRLHAELLGEEVTDLPADVTVPDFERFALRIAVQCLEGPEVVLPAWAKEPEILALHVKQLLVQHLPSEYLRIEKNPGLLPPDYTYQFTSPLPRRLLLEAAETAGILAPGAG